MKIVMFSPIHCRDAQHAQDLIPEVEEWEDRVCSSFSNPDENFADIYTFVLECGAVHGFLRPTGSDIRFARIPQDRRYSPQNWSYAAAGVNCGLHMAWQQHPDADLYGVLYTDAILGVSLQRYVKEFMSRPEIIMGNAMTSVKIDSHLMLLKPAGALHLMYSLPFLLLGKNEKDYEGTLYEAFQGRWFDPWPQFPSTRHWYSKDATKEEIMQWPLFAYPFDRETPAQYRKAHPLPLQ